MASKKKQVIYLKIFIILCLVLSIFWITDNIIINGSKSHDGQVFWISKKQPTYNDYVFFKLDHKILKNQKADFLSKKIFCLEEDFLIVKENYISCNGVKININRKYKSNKKQTIEQFYFEGDIPKDKALVLGDNKNSFDSRYFGFIDYKELNRMILLF